MDEKVNHILKKYNVRLAEQPDLGMYGSYATKAICNIDARGITIRSDLNETMKLIAIAHEIGHILNYDKDSRFEGSRLKIETKAWLTGLPIACELGVYQEYIDYWKIHLEKQEG